MLPTKLFIALAQPLVGAVSRSRLCARSAGVEPGGLVMLWLWEWRVLAYVHALPRMYGLQSWANDGRRCGVRDEETRPVAPIDRQHPDMLAHLARVAGGV